MTTYTKMLIGHRADYSIKWFQIIKGGLIAYKHCDEWIVVDMVRGTK
ncbi:MAG: hypothetical protein LBB59_04695 [Campylobacteraceae bacterium]|jgi:hypothetical protein|nr:hypothetical protein [Campylobacteraceae bacterium]